LPEPRAALVAGHEAQCDACHAYVLDLKLLAAKMSQLGREPAPPGLEERIRALLSQEEGPAVIPFPVPRRWPGFVQQLASLAAVCLISVFGTWAVVHQPASVPETQHD